MPDGHEHDWQVDYGDEVGRHYRCAGCPETRTVPHRWGSNRHAAATVSALPVVDPPVVTVLRKVIEEALRAYDEETGELVAMPDDEALTKAAHAVYERVKGAGL